MKSAAPFCIVLVTVPSLRTARALSGGMLRQKLAACVNIVPALESHYTWKGKIEKSKELLLLIKSRKVSLKALEEFIHSNHPYETPEFIVVSLAQGSAGYLDWLHAQTA